MRAAHDALEQRAVAVVLRQHRVLIEDERPMLAQRARGAAQHRLLEALDVDLEEADARREL